MTETPTGGASRRKVIVVDDEHVIAETLALILNNAGFEARSVFCGEEVLKLLESFPPDVLIADVIMASMNGIDTAIVVKERLPKCRILLFSGQAATSDLLDQARIRGYDFEILPKPVHPTDLLARLNR
jgi:DNA-binding response OmpR family regulator